MTRHMHAIDALMDEHALILRVLDALEAWSARPDPDLANGPGELALFVRFMKDFVDPIHHAKEEGILFETMTRYGFPRDFGPIPCMLAEHVACRERVADMSALASCAGAWTDEEREAAIAAARSYVAMLRAHIAKEDNVLYPMANGRLPAHVKADVDARCDRFTDAPVRARIAAAEALGEAVVALYLG